MVDLLQVPKGLQRALGRPPKQSTILFQFLLQCLFSQPGKKKWFEVFVYVFEVLTDECVELW